MDAINKMFEDMFEVLERQAAKGHNTSLSATIGKVEADRLELESRRIGTGWRRW